MGIRLVKYGTQAVNILEICTLLGCYVACSGNSLPTFRDRWAVPKCQ